MQGHGIGILNKDPRSNYMQYDIHQHLLTGIILVCTFMFLYSYTARSFIDVILVNDKDKVGIQARTYLQLPLRNIL
jgi:hypothetical protein